MFLLKTPPKKERKRQVLKTGFLASVVSFLWFCPWNEQWKPTKSSWLADIFGASIRTIQN